jgi:hypothetical protein
MQPDDIGAVASYAGYEYQLLVSVWVALELIVSRGYCESIEIEPASQEDIAAELKVPDDSAEAMVGIAATDGPIHIQVKKRSSFWGVGEFRNLLTTPAKRGQRGPEPRQRALSRLQAAPTGRYLLITDAEVHPELKAFVVDTIGRTSRARDLPGGQVTPETACRIGVLEKRLGRLIEKDIDDLLELSARVPLQRVSECRAALIERVRERLLGRQPAQLHQAELERLITKCGGFPPSASDEFVPPVNFTELLRKLEEPPFALILVGPPGIGKTSVATRLVDAHRHVARPFQVLPNPKTPTEVREKLREPGRILFYFEDPWGHYRLAETAELWSDEIPRLIRQANGNPDKRFLITSRTALLAESLEFGEEGHGANRHSRALRPFIAQLTVADFPPSSRREILRRWMRGATRWQRDWVDDRSLDIVSGLLVPQALHTFAHRVREVSRDSDALNLEQLLRESQVDAIGAVIARTVRHLDAVRAAVPLWAFLSTGEPLTAELSRSLSVWLEEDERLEADILSLARYLTANGWLTQIGDAWNAHPTVINGIELLVDKERATTERGLRALLNVLVDHEHVDIATRLMLGLHGRSLPLPPPVREAINSRLRDAVLCSDDMHFISATEDLSRISTARDPVSLVCRAMASQRQARGLGFDSWKPPDWTPEEWAAVRASLPAEQLVRRYARRGMTGLRFWYDEERFIQFLWSLGWDLSDEFTLGALQALEQGAPHAETLLRGALQAQFPPYERLLTAALAAYDAVAQWWNREGYEAQVHAEEGELDAARSASILDEPSSRFHDPTCALEIIVSLRRAQESFYWLAEHPRREVLIEAWAKTILYDTGDASRIELLALHKNAKTWNRVYVWEAIGRARCQGLTDLVLDALASGPVVQLMAVWGALFGLLDAERLPAAVSSLLQSLPWPSRAAAVFASQEAGIPDRGDHHFRDPESHRNAIFDLLAPQERRALQACRSVEKSDEMEAELQLDSSVLELIAAFLDGEHETLSALGCVVLAAHHRPTRTTLKRLLDSTHKWVRLHAMRALHALPAPEHRQICFRLLEDPYYQCRRLSMYLLARNASEEERKAIIAKAGEPSAPIREACARIIGEQRWEEGLETLCSLLSDSRNRSEGSLGEDDVPNHHVARAAARALHKFEVPLPAKIRQSVLTFLQRGSRANQDVAVHHELIKVIVREQDPLVPILIQRLLHSSRRMGNEKEGTFPLRYAAAWGWVNHVLQYPEDATLVEPSALAEAAGHTDARLAAPALVSLGILSQHAQSEIQQALAGDEMTDERALLIETGSRIANVPMKSELLAQRISDAHPGRRLIAACWDENLDHERWKKTVERDAAIQAWLRKIREHTPVYAALRKLLKISPRGELLSELPTGDFRKGEYAPASNVITMFRFAGLE